MTDKEFEAAQILADAFKKANELSGNWRYRNEMLHYQAKVFHERESRIKEARK